MEGNVELAAVIHESRVEEKQKFRSRSTHGIEIVTRDFFSFLRHSNSRKILDEKRHYLPQELMSFGSYNPIRG